MTSRRRFTFTAPAQRDLAETWAWVVTGSGRPRADGVLDRLRETCRVVAEGPLIGRERPELRAGARSFAVPPHVIIYEATERGIRVLRVLHGARQLPRAMHEASAPAED
ncbi:MAG: type II toxin-antitoxin system RelE/ParE family toxin [Geminicoccaceae bacterium]